ncbi:MAG: M64 family metallopeptidase [Candidatus Zixiibacteriota bacterium]
MRLSISALLATAVTCILALYPSLALSQGTLNQIVDNGPVDKRLNIVILAEGYNALEADEFDADAADMMDFFLNSTVPFSEYSTYFNVFTIYVASLQSGSDHPFSGIYRETYFNSTYDSYGIQRLITIPPNDYDPVYSHGEGKVYDLLEALIPEYDIILLLVNDSEYGGSGGVMALSSTHPAAPEIVKHELGHSFGELADEYEDYTPGYYGYESPNTTAETNRELIKWTNWILSSTPVPTPETSEWQNVVGLFEGACYEPLGWYRPELACEMRNLYNDFCEVCKEQLVISQYSRLSPIEYYSPTETTILLAEIDTITLSIQPMAPTYHDLAVQWHMDGSPIPGENATDYLVEAAEICGGTHQVSIEVTDTTSRVRTDAENLLRDTHTWTVECFSNCGDADGSTEIDIDDAVFLISYIFTGGHPPVPIETGDADCSSAIDIDDVVYLISYIFTGGPQPCDTNGDGTPDC